MGPQIWFICGVLFALAYLFIDGWRSGAVWVRGASPGKSARDEWAHKRSREDSPKTYWVAMGFYGIGFLFLLGLTLRDLLAA